MTSTARVTVDIEQIVSTTLDFSSKDIEILNIPEGFEAELNNDVVLTVSGPQSIIDKVNKSIVNIFVDILGLAEGEHTVEVKAEILQPYNIIRIEPGELKITLRSL